MPSAKRPAPPAVSLSTGGVRYEPLPNARAEGFAQDGGVIAAIDERSGATLWTLEVWRDPRDAGLERDVQDVHVAALALDAAGDALVVTDERGSGWRVDLATRAVVPLP